MRSGDRSAIPASPVAGHQPPRPPRAVVERAGSTGVRPAHSAVDLFWIPLGAGGAGFVRVNGRLYEAWAAHLDRRPRQDLYHTALVVRIPEGCFVIENAWPSPDADLRSRGVVRVGPVFDRRVAGVRWLRYEIRCWRDGVIQDVAQSVASPRRLSDDPHLAQRLLDLVGVVPDLTWGRDEQGTGEMWNSNAVVAWLLARSGVSMETIQPPAGGRAPGWNAGITVAGRADGPSRR